MAVKVQSERIKTEILKSYEEGKNEYEVRIKNIESKMD